MSRASRLGRQPIQFAGVATDPWGPGGALLWIYHWLPALSFLYASVLFPLLLLSSPADILESRIEHRIFWPAVAAMSLSISFLLLKTRPAPRLSGTTLILFAYLVLACMSVGWSLTPDVTSKRVMQQLFVVMATVVPVLLATDRDAIARNMLICLFIGSVANLVFVVIRPPTHLGHAGIYTQKNMLGQFAAVAFIYSIRYWTPALPRQFFCGIFVGAATLVLLVMSQSKTSLGLALGMPMIAGFALIASRTVQVSPRVMMLVTALLASLTGFLVADGLNIAVEDVSLALFNDPTFTGRTFIWSFAVEMAERRPLLGWGYQSFWLVARDAPSVVEAPGFVAVMPHAHNGYLDVVLETGWLGLAVLVTMIVSALSRASVQLSRTGWVNFSTILFLILYNMMESSWTRGFDLAWLMFLIVAAEINHDARSAGDERLRDVKPYAGLRPNADRL